MRRHAGKTAVEERSYLRGVENEVSLRTKLPWRHKCPNGSKNGRRFTASISPSGEEGLMSDTLRGRLSYVARRNRRERTSREYLSLPVETLGAYATGSQGTSA